MTLNTLIHFNWNKLKHYTGNSGSSNTNRTKIRGMNSGAPEEYPAVSVPPVVPIMLLYLS